jgi:proline-rich protein PRCC
MMLGIEDYGSDNDSDTELTPNPPPPPTKKSSLSLPPPSKSNSTGLSLPAPKLKRGPKKITIGLPSLPGESDDEDKDERPAAKKPRLDSGSGGKGKSSLLSMLPAPKQKVPVAPAPERVLGGGKGPGLVFNTAKPFIAPALVDPTNDDADASAEADLDALTTNGDLEEEPKSKTSSVSFLPPSLKKGRSNISVEEGKAPPRPAPKISAAPAVDFFSLGVILRYLSNFTS